MLLLSVFWAGVEGNEARALPAPFMGVREIKVQGLHSIQKQELLDLLGIREGVTLSLDSVKRGIKRAFVKEIFEDISVRLDNSGRVDIAVVERDFINKILVRGNKAINKRLIRKHFALKQGGLMRYDLLEGDLRQLQEVLAKKGFPEARVSAQVQDTGKPYSVDLVLDVWEGEPLKVKAIKIHGRPHREVRARMKLDEDERYDQYKLREDFQKIKAYYVKQGYLDPSVGPYTFMDGELNLSVTPGKRLVIKFKGNAALKDKFLLGAMPFFEAGDFRDELIEEAVLKILAIYHTEGYAFAKVAPVISGPQNEKTLHFFVYEGEKIKVSSITLKGATIEEKPLKKAMSLRERATYNSDTLKSDVQAIRELYLALGYLKVKVLKPSVEIKNNFAKIEITVDEGRSTKILEVSILGTSLLKEARVRAAAAIEFGATYNEVDLVDARRRILTLYSSEGFADASVEINREFIGDRGSVTFTVSEGPRTIIGKTVVVGNKKTRLAVIKREFEHHEGGPLDLASLNRTRQKLLRLGLFTEISVAVLQMSAGVADIAVRVREGSAGTVELGLGYGEYEEYRTSLDVSYRNLWGMNRQASVRAEFSSLEARLILNYYDPWFMDWQVPLRSYFLFEDRTETNIDTGETHYRVKRQTASIGTERKVREKTKADLFYKFSLVNTFDVSPGLVLSKEDTGTLAISSIRPGIVYDSRDNPFNPQQGYLAGMTLEVATAFLFSETDFAKLILHGSKYLKVGSRLVVALSLKGGAAMGFADTSELPIVERFYLGGRSTVRGYDQDSLGPKTDFGVPTGGNAFLLGNLELRRRVTKSWSLVGFLDSGTVWLGTSDVSLSDVKTTTGLGLRYNTPVGPLRLDYGYKLRKKLGESKGALHFSIGHTF